MLEIVFMVFQSYEGILFWQFCNSIGEIKIFGKFISFKIDSFRGVGAALLAWLYHTVLEVFFVFRFVHLIKVYIDITDTILRNRWYIDVVIYSETNLSIADSSL